MGTKYELVQMQLDVDREYGRNFKGIKELHKILVAKTLLVALAFDFECVLGRCGLLISNHLYLRGIRARWQSQLRWPSYSSQITVS